MSIYFQEPSTDGAPGIWSLDDALRYQAQGKWPTIPPTVPSWLKRGPDGALPSLQAEYTIGRGWLGGKPYATLDAFQRAATGTFSRASDGTFFGADGLLKTAGPGVRRLTYDPVPRKALGYLAGGGSTNLTTNSEDFANAAWSKENTSITSAAGMAPDGTMTASLVTTTTASGFRSLRKVNHTGLSGAFVASIYLKHQSGSGEINIVIQGVSGTDYVARFNVLTGTITTAGTNGSTALIAPGPMGFWRISLAVPTGDNDSSNIVKFVDFHTSQGLGASVLAWGAQIETGGFPTSYIRTTSGAVQRFADALVYDMAGTPEGTVVVEGVAAIGLLSSGNHFLWQWGPTEYLLLYKSALSSRQIVFSGRTSSSGTVFQNGLGSLADGAPLKVAASWRQGRFAASLNGGAPVVNTSYAGDLPIMSSMRVGHGGGGNNPWGGTIANLRLYPKSYDPADLQGMSAL